MNAPLDPRGLAGTSVVTLLAIVAFGCVVASPPAADAAGGNVTLALHAALQSGERR